MADDRDARIRVLENALYFARQTIVDLMPPKAREVLEAAIWCDSFRDVTDWERWAVARLVDMAEPIPGYEVASSYMAVRVTCPLCRSEAQSNITRGFALPNGLARHLHGSHGSRRCGVFSAAFDPCIERARERARPGYEGVKFSDSPDAVPPWKRVPPAPPRKSAEIIKLR